VVEPIRGQPTRTGAEHIGDDNPIWRFPGFRVEATRAWGLISADIVSRDAGDATWQSDRHPIVYALTDISGAMESDGRRVHRSMDRGKVSFPAGGGDSQDRSGRAGADDTDPAKSRYLPEFRR
jgi:hypothetical protein